MKPQHTLVFCISPHGYGHAAQSSSVINLLLEQYPDIEVYVKTSLPEAFIRERFDQNVKILPQVIDFGMVMASSIDILEEESFSRYQSIHEQWEVMVEQECKDLINVQPHLIVSNVAYVCLEAAHRLNIPSLAMGSLNWADIFDHYCGHYEEAPSVVSQMKSAYNHAQAFIQLTPCPPMPWIDNRQAIPPVTRLGQNKHALIRQQLKCSQDVQLILIGLGGIEMRLPIETWPTRANTVWIIPDEWDCQRKDCVPISQLGLPFIDLLASVDALITKPGYGTFSEAVCNKIPFLYVPRGDWPEEPYLEAWAKKFGIAESISRQSLKEGGFYANLNDILSQDKKLKTPPKADGAQKAVDIIVSTLTQQGV